MGNAHSEAGSGSSGATPGKPHGHTAWANVEGATCPVKHDSPNLHKALMGGSKPGGAPGACPVVHEGSGSTAAAAGAADAKQPAESPRFKGPVYNVYSQEIDPANMMPPANQNPAPGQQAPLSTERVKSNIPKGGTDGTWLYPSPQMFWNSLVRKGKADGVAETDIDTVVAIHNEMNERTWRQLLAWEEGHKGEHLDGEPALRRFQGNPWSPSPKARVKSALGYGWPFDRHDWYVDRAGQQKHYIIDYYFNPAGPALSKEEIDRLGLKYTHMIHVDVRPAVDDVTSAVDRIKGFPARAMDALKRPRYVAEGLDPAHAPKEEVKHSSDSLGAAAGAGSASASAAPASAATATATPGSKWEEAEVKCAPRLAALQAAKDEDARRPAYMAFNYCMGRVLCPTEAASFMSILESNAAAGTDGTAGGPEEAAFEAMSRCVIKEMQARPKPRNIQQVAGAGAGGQQKLQ